MLLYPGLAECSWDKCGLIVFLKLVGELEASYPEQVHQELLDQLKCFRSDINVRRSLENRAWKTRNSGEASQEWSCMERDLQDF